jgi:hypothetical protein
MVNAIISAYLEVGGKRNQFKTNLGKPVKETVSKDKLGMHGCACNPSCSRSIGRKQT